MALCLLALASAGCDAQLEGRPTGPIDESRSNAPDDVCEDNDRYADGLCDPGCLHPDPDCLDCASVARRAAYDLERVNGRTPSRLAAETMTLPDSGGQQLIRVLGDELEYVVSTEVDHEQGGSFSEFCVAHGLQDAGRLVQLIDSDAGTASVAPPTEACAEAASQAVVNLEIQAARGVLGPDGTRAVEEDDDGFEVPLSESRIAHVELVGLGTDGEVLRVHVQRRGDWSIDTESYLVNTRLRGDDDETRCEVLGLQSKTHQVDMRP
jgi:hypothetical protein